MSKLLLAPNFQLKAIVEMFKVTETMERVQQNQQKQEKKSLSKAALKKQKQLEDAEPRQMVRKMDRVGEIGIELNLQMGDTEEELMKNYKMKLQH